jgi:virulence-associated protein VapD
MFAIAFDLTVADTEQYHPKGVTQAYSDIATTLNRFNFARIQGAFMSANRKIWPTCFKQFLR